MIINVSLHEQKDRWPTTVTFRTHTYEIKAHVWKSIYVYIITGKTQHYKQNINEIKGKFKIILNYSNLVSSPYSCNNLSLPSSVEGRKKGRKSERTTMVNDF